MKRKKKGAYYEQVTKEINKFSRLVTNLLCRYQVCTCTYIRKRALHHIEFTIYIIKKRASCILFLEDMKDERMKKDSEWER